MAAQDFEQVTYNAPGGAQMGASATEKIAFFGATPIAQRSSSAQTTVTVTFSNNTTLGFASTAGFNALIATVNEIQATLTLLGLWKGS